MYAEGKVTFNDSYKKIVFGKPPKCQSVDTYDFKYYPIVLVGLGPTAARDCAINKFKDYYTNELGVVDSIYGGFATVTLNFQIRARSEDERNNLADLVLMYINSIDTKRAFERDFGMRIIGAPSLSGESVEDDPQTNVKQFIVNLSQQIDNDYEEGIDIIDTLGNTGLTVEEIVAYTPIVHCKVILADGSAPYNTFRADAVEDDALILVDDYYVGFTVRFTSDNDLEGVTKNVIGYTASTKTFIIDNVSSPILINTTFEIRGSS